MNAHINEGAVGTLQKGGGNVQTVKVTDLMPEGEGDKIHISYLKIDVEGFDIAAIESSLPLLQNRSFGSLHPRTPRIHFPGSRLVHLHLSRKIRFRSHRHSPACRPIIPVLTSKFTAPQASFKRGCRVWAAESMDFGHQRCLRASKGDRDSRKGGPKRV